MQYPIPDGDGNDLIVHEGDTSAEGYSVFAGETIDGPWFSLGDGNGTTEFDLASGNLIEAQFIKIVDDGDGVAIAANAGFDLDAVEAISEVSGVYIAFLGYELDEMIGNTNGFIDPGETMDMLVTIRNNGSQLAEDVSGILSSTSGYIVMNNGDVSFGSLAPGQEDSGIFTFTVDTATPIGELLTFDLEIEANAGSYVTNFNIDCIVGIAKEDFETNNFVSFDWEFDGDADWTISTDAYEGLYSAQSGNINDNQSTSLLLTAEVLADGELSFYKKVSSEGSWDFLHFYLDNEELGSWSGEVSWSQETYQVSAGTHTFKWEYTKDGSVSNGSDCGWIDYIVFPPINIEIQLYPPTNLQAEIVDYNSSIIISWDSTTRSKVKNRDFIGYNIYRDGDFLTFTTETSFESIGPFGPEDFYFEVTAVYHEGESEAAEITVTIVLNPPSNVIAESQPPNIIVTWDAPERGINSYNVYRDGALLEEGIQGNPMLYIDIGVPTGTYIYNVTAVYDGGWESDMSEEEPVYHVDASNVLVPIITKLAGNYPNPFNPTTTISFSTKEAGYVSINIYNMKGQLVKTLINDQLDAAFHDVIWNGKDDSNKTISSGIYFYKMNANNYAATKKMILMK